MNANLEFLEAEVMKLPSADRARLLERLIASLDADPAIDVAWEREAARREAQLTDGTVSEIPGHEAIARLRARLVK
ncbi:addiction module protein [Duganella sp. LX20W]|uniref:Addiction module protein n=1 Tax=Rugamonas brunnea TaxID=2758569 RepID=A0A7W2EW21_9BURK|nr:addiction module protein [Rugamonas brunnea]MBA5639662.1 addiction module protein [Rugamonas brunnea]